MSIRKQIMKDIENKQAQAREQYAKNKNLLGEIQVKERATDYTHPNKNHSGKK